MDAIGSNIIDPKKVLFLSVITWGLYDFFWFYKNWKLIKQKEMSKISPFWRSTLSVFYCYSFFKRSLDAAKVYGYVEKYSAKNIAIGYIVLTFVGMILGKTIPNMGIFGLIFSLIGLAASMALFETQKAMNFAFEHESGVVNLEMPYTFGEKAMVVFGIVYTLFNISSPFLGV